MPKTYRLVFSGPAGRATITHLESVDGVVVKQDVWQQGAYMAWLLDGSGVSPACTIDALQEMVSAPSYHGVVRELNECMSVDPDLCREVKRMAKKLGIDKMPRRCTPGSGSARDNKIEAAFNKMQDYLDYRKAKWDGSLYR
jgi:hypothetical protein